MSTISVPDRAVIHEAPASVGQRMLWLIEHYRGGHGRLNYPLLLRIRGRIDMATLQRALDQLVARHETLRTTFARRGGLLTQLIHQPGPVPVNTVQVNPHPGPAGVEAVLWESVHEEVTRSIDPKSSPIRVTLWSAGRDEHLLCVNAHHLVTDAWSCRILVEELVLLLGAGADLPRQGWQYRHFVQWQRRKTTASRQESDKEYWARQLDGARAPALPVRADSGPPEGPAYRSRQVDIGPGTWGRVRQLARDEQTTPFTVLLSLYYALLHRESGDADLCLASPFANRTRPEVMRTVGFFANLLVLRACVQPGGSFLELLRRARTTVNEALSHQGYAHFLPPAGTGAGQPRNIEDIIFQMLPELPPPITTGGLEIEVLPPIVASRFDLELSLLPHAGGVRALFQYAPHRLDDALADRMVSGCAQLIELLGHGRDFQI